MQGLTRRGIGRNVTFDVRRGEILGFAGLVRGAHETMRMIFGADPGDGYIWLDGQEVEINSPRMRSNTGSGWS